LGQNAYWNNSAFKSNNISLISATKSAGTISLSFQGGT
jgi:hypothetical protein